MLLLLNYFVQFHYPASLACQCTGAGHKYQHCIFIDCFRQFCPLPNGECPKVVKRKLRQRAYFFVFIIAPVFTFNQINISSQSGFFRAVMNTDNLQITFGNCLKQFRHPQQCWKPLRSLHLGDSFEANPCPKSKSSGNQVLQVVLLSHHNQQSNRIGITTAYDKINT